MGFQLPLEAHSVSCQVEFDSDRCVLRFLLHHVKEQGTLLFIGSNFIIEGMLYCLTGDIVEDHRLGLKRQ